MKTKIENAFDEDGIPFDPNVTNEYYNNDDFENDSSPERKPNQSYSTFKNNVTRNSMSRTIAPNRRRVTTAVPKHRLTSSKSSSSLNQNNLQTSNLIASKTFSSAQPRSTAATRMEYEQLISMENALTGINKSER